MARGEVSSAAANKASAVQVPIIEDKGKSKRLRPPIAALSCPLDALKINKANTTSTAYNTSHRVKRTHCDLWALLEAIRRISRISLH